MTKVAVVDTHPQVGGVRVLSAYVVAGLNDADARARLTTFTASGRASKNMALVSRVDSILRRGGQFEQVFRWSEAADVLRGADLVVLGDLSSHAADKHARRSGSKLPPYLQAVADSGTPWTAFVHGNKLYSADRHRRTSFVREALDLPNFCGTLLTFQPSENTVDDVFEGADVRYVGVNPYEPTWTGPSGGTTVITTGRYASNKHQRTLALAADRFLPSGWTFRIAGDEMGGPGPRGTFLLYEELLARGWRGVRPQAKPSALVQWAACKDGREVIWTGPYEDPHDVLHDASVFVSGTAYNLSNGVLEYSGLEAMDVGLLPVLPYHGVSERHRHRYDAIFYDGFDVVDKERAVDSVVDAVQDAVARVRREFDAQPWATANRRAIQDLHAPVHLGRKILELTT